MVMCITCIVYNECGCYGMSIDSDCSSSTLAGSSPTRELEFGALSSHFDVSFLSPNVTSPITSGMKAELAIDTKLPCLVSALTK